MRKRTSAAALLLAGILMAPGALADSKNVALVPNAVKVISSDPFPVEDVVFQVTSGSRDGTLNYSITYNPEKLTGNGSLRVSLPSPINVTDTGDVLYFNPPTAATVTNNHDRSLIVEPAVRLSSDGASNCFLDNATVTSTCPNIGYLSVEPPLDPTQPRRLFVDVVLQIHFKDELTYGDRVTVRFYYLVQSQDLSLTFFKFYEYIRPFVDCTDGPVRTRYFCNSSNDQPNTDNTEYDQSAVFVVLQYAPIDLKGTLTLNLRESVYDGPDRVSLLLNYDMAYPDPDMPGGVGPAGYTGRLLRGLSPPRDVYRWTFEAKITTVSGQVVRASKSFDVQSIYIPRKDVPGPDYTPTVLNASSLPPSVCVPLYYNNPTDALIYLQPLTSYGPFSDTQDTAKDPKQIFAQPHSLETSPVPLCHNIDANLLSQQDAQTVVHFKTSPYYSYIFGYKFFRAVHPVTLPPGPSRTQAGPITLDTTSNGSPKTTNATSSQQPITTVDDALTYVGIHFGTKNESNARGLSRRDARAGLNPRDVLGINSTVQFSDAIPNDGSFTATVTYAYNPADLPSDPNFTESALQILSFDPNTGVLQAYPSVVDAVNHTVSAKVQALPVYISAGVVGPFPGVTLTSPVPPGEFGVQLALVNIGTGAAQLMSTSYPAGGGRAQGAPVQFSLGAGQQASSAGAGLSDLAANGWLQIASDQASVGGVAWLASAGGRMDTVPLQSSPHAFGVLSGVEIGNGVSTEVVVTNTSDWNADVTLELRDPATYALVDSAQRTLSARQSLHEDGAAMFPNAPQPFQGFIVVQSTQKVAAARVWQGGGSIASANWQTSDDLRTGAQHYVLPFVAGGASASRLNLLNPTRSDTNVTLTAQAQNGSPVGQPVTVVVAAGTQYWEDIASLFSVGSGTTATPGTLIIDTSSGLFGDIGFGDAGYRNWTSLALNQPAAPSLVIPLVWNQSTQPMGLVVANAGTSAANVSLHVLRSDGTEAGAVKWRIPAGVASWDLVTARVPASDGQTGGQLHLDSDQPILAVGLLGTSNTDSAAVPGFPTTVVLQPVAGPNNSPAISVSSQSLTFGPVTVGQAPATQKFTISNSGTADLHISTISEAGDASFTLAPAFAPLTIAPGKSADVTVKFAPTAAGSVSKILTIGSDDATNSSVTVQLSGIANPPNTGTGGQCLAPPSNLLSWWSGDGNANDSNGGNNLTVQGGATFAAGQVGQAFQFDGSTGYASAGNAGNLRFTSALTIEAWINPRGAPTTGNMQAILTKWGQVFQDTADSDSYGLWFRNDARAGLSLFGAIHQSGGKEPHVLGGAIPLNTWTHVAVTFDSATGQLTGYVNGQVADSLTSVGPIFTSSRNVLIGREDSIQPRPFNGLIDEVTVYGRALSGAEIQGIYNAGTAGKCKGASGGGGTLSASPSSLDFGSSSTPVTKTVTLNNTTAAAISISQATIMPSSAPFAVVTTLPLTIPANGQLAIGVQFTPGAAGLQSATLALGSLSIPLTGTATPASGGGSGNIVSLKMESGTYESNSKTFTVTPVPNPPCPGPPGGPCVAFDTDDSTGNWALGVSAVGATNPLLNDVPKKALKNPLPAGSYYAYNNDAWTWNTHMRLTLQWSSGTSDVAYFQVNGFDNNTVWTRVGGAANLSVTYKVIQPYVCKVYFGSTQPPPGCGSSNQVFQLDITGGSSGGGPTGGGGAISVSPQSLDFGQVTVGQSSQSKTVTITNGGGSTATVNLSTLAPFAVLPTSLTLAANGGTGTAFVLFLPTSPTSAASSLNIAVSGQSTPAASVTLAGTGTSAGGGGGTGGACAAPPGNLVSWWSGDGNANDSNGGNNLSLQGGATFAAGQVGQAFQFDGSTGYASAGNPASLTFTSALTIEAWINPKAGPIGSGNMAAVLSKWGQQFNPTPNTDSYGLWLRNTGSALIMFTAIHQAGTSEPNVQGGSIPLNTWTHVAMTFDAASGRLVLYVNGQAVGSVISPGSILSSTRNAFIGREDSSSPRPFNGLIDEVSVYGRELSATEIQAIFNAGASGKCKPAGGGGGTPTILVTAPNLDFGTVTTGATKDLTLTIANTGTATLSVTPSFTPNPPFSIVSPAGSPSVNAGTQQIMTVRFSPITSGAQNGTLTLTSSDPAHPTTTLQFKGTAIGGGSPACLAVPSNLVSWWTGDGNANDATGGLNGTLQGGTSFAAGEAGQAFQFDGSTGYVSLGNPLKLQFTSAMTIEAWINPKAGPIGSGHMAAVLSKWGQQFNPTPDTDSYGLWLRNTGSALIMFTAIHQAGTSEPNVQGGSIPLNTWTHVAMTFDAASGRLVLYVNGQAVGSVISPGSILSSTRNAFIGREDSSSPRPFNGLIDEVSVYSRELTALEIQSIFSVGASGKCKPRSIGGGGTGGGGSSTGNGPNRASGAVIDPNNSLASSLVGLFLMNEGSGTLDRNIADSQTAAFAGTNPPTWNTSDPSIVFNGGGYLNAGTDLAFDKLTVSKMTIVGRVFLNSGAAGGIAEKNDGNSLDSGFVFGLDGNGGLHFVVEQSGTDTRVNSNAALITTGQWIQVAVTWDGSISPAAANAHLYLNGVELAKSQNSTGNGTLGYSNATNRPFLIGNVSFDFSGTGSLNGKMEYLAVYKGRILTPAELVQLDAALPIK